MRRFGDTDRFLELLDTIRSKAPQAGVRSNFIVGFPGESASDLAELERFLSHARLDAIGVFGYSDEEGTEAAGYDGKLDEDVVAERLARVSRLAEELVSQRAEERVGETVHVLVESVDEEEGVYGRAAHQAPETDGQVLLTSGEGTECRPYGRGEGGRHGRCRPGGRAALRGLARAHRGGGQMTGVPASAAGGPSGARRAKGPASGGLTPASGRALAREAQGHGSGRVRRRAGTA
ncbi:hypothetical protein GCM10019016_039390 [Streptomyces prasinosporus]|uniref:Radical SAM core domain-containing protein n=2 Tax=Streptomyces prasinosporus TaxID=68256 RepID=A0ABP6TQ90_9ACTN